MRIPFFTAAICSLAILFSGCSGLKLNERVAASSELQEAVTYSWKQKPPVAKSSVDKSSVNFDTNVRLAVNSILALKGYKEVSQGADFQMDYRVTVVPEQQTPEQYRGGAGSIIMDSQQGPSGRIEFSQWGNTQAESEFYERGYLALTAFAPTKPVIWWETIANKMISVTDSEQQRANTLRQAISKMMKTFPNAGGK